MNDVELKNCKICGGSAKISAFIHYHGDEAPSISCDQCGLVILNDYLNAKGLCEAWNKLMSDDKK